jgi:hypothetical protein
MLSLLQRGITRRQWMGLFFLSLPGALLFEVPLLMMGAIDYYGANQPAKILGYPIWMAFANSCTLFVMAAAIFLLAQTQIIRARPWLLAPLTPMLVMGANGAAALPLASAINASSSLIVVNLCAVLSALLATLYVWIFGYILQEAFSRSAISQ